MKLLMSMIALLGLCATSAFAQTLTENPPGLAPQKMIALPNGSGKFDHLAYDEKGGRLFIAGSSSHAIIVVDAKSGNILETVTGLGKPHGLAWISGPQGEPGRLFVADGSLGALNVYQGSPLTLIKSIKLSDDADDMAYDEIGKVLYVGHGGSGASAPARVAVIDTSKLEALTDLPMATHPEALEMDTRGRRVFVNVADSNEVVVINADTHAVTDHWPIKRAGHNVPLAFDGDTGLLLIGCRNPAKVLVLDTKTGKEIADAPTSAGADDLFYNTAAHAAYLVAGSGNVDIYHLLSTGKLESAGSVKTMPGAKTGLFVPSLATLFVGVPQATGQDAAILSFSMAK